MRIAEFQKLIKDIYFEKDKARGVMPTFLWIIEEVGELAECILKRGDKENIKEEIADVIAWIFSLANLLGIDVEEAIKSKYLDVCPKCKSRPCVCKEVKSTIKL